MNLTTHGLSHGLLGRVGGLALSGAFHVALGAFLFQVQAEGAPDRGVASGQGGQAFVVELVSVKTGAPRVTTSLEPSPSTVAATSPAAPATGLSGQTSPRPPSPAAGAETGGPPSSERAGQLRRLSDLPNDEVMAYRRRLEQHLARHRVYPAEASAAGRKGLTTVHFTMTRDGRVIDAWIEASSGENAIDDEAVAAIFRAQPLPTLPQDWPSRLDVSLPVNFSLR